MQPRALPFAGESAWARLVPSWPIAAFLLALYPALTQRLSLLNDPDTYLHIAAGRWMLEHLSLPLHDPFSHTMPGAAWVPHEWLAELVLASSYALAGWSGAIALTAACFALALAILTRFVLARIEKLPGLLLVCASCALLLPHLLARPHILALPCIVLWSGALFAARDAGRLPPLWALAVLVLWANLHGSFVAGLGLAVWLGAEAAIWPAAGKTRADEVRRWGIFVLLAGAAGLATPNHIEGLLQPLRLIAMPHLQASFVEWQSPALASFPSLELWVLGALAAALGAGLRLPLPRLGLLLVLLHTTLQHSRHADLLAVIAPLAIAAPLGPQLRALLPGRAGPAIDRAAANAVAAVLAAAILTFVASQPLTRGDAAVTPAAALAAAERAGVTGAVLNEETFGGYLVFRGVPVFIDGRIEMYGDGFLAHYLDVTQNPSARLADALAQYRIGWTLLRPDNAAIAVLDALPGWRRLYADAFAVVHARAAVDGP